MSQHGVIGGRAKRVDAWDKVTGQATYPGDMHLDGLLYAAVLRSPGSESTSASRSGG